MFRSLREKKQSISGKLFGALFGLALFAGSFFLLWSNEGRVNYADIAEESISVSADQVGLSYPGELIALEGDLISEDKITDPDFIKLSSYIQLNRIVEMYAWEETEVTEDDETYFEYKEIWTETPENSNKFYDPDFFNPVMGYKSLSFTVPTAKIGLYEIDPSSIQFPDPAKLDLINENLKDEIIQSSLVSISNDYLYFGISTVENPEIGDLRISFTALSPKNSITAFGSIKDEQLTPYFFEEEETLYRLFFVDRESAILQMEEEYSAALWGARFAGFALMWCGMFLVLNPITILLTFLPILERAGFWILIAITFPVAAIISILLVLFSFLAHNPFILIGIILLTILIIGAIAGGLFKLDKRKKEETSSENAASHL